MTAQQAAVKFGKSVSTIYRWIKRGKLSAGKVRGRWVIAVVELRSNRWQKYGKDRLYLERATGFKNRPFEQLGYVDMLTGEIVGNRYSAQAIRTLAFQAGLAI